MPAAVPTDDLIGAAALAISAAVWATYRMEPTDAAALNVVLAEPGISISRLSRVLGLSHSAAVRVTDRLEHRELVTRSPAGPGRTVALAVTARGQRLAGAGARTRDGRADGRRAAEPDHAAGYGSPPAGRRPGPDRPGMPPVRPAALPQPPLPVASLNTAVGLAARPVPDPRGMAQPRCHRSTQTRSGPPSRPVGSPAAAPLQAASDIPAAAPNLARPAASGRQG